MRRTRAINPEVQEICLPSLPRVRHRTLYELLRQVAMFADCDLVFVEGNLRTAAPKAELCRAAVTEVPIAAQDSSILAVITDDPIDVAIATWSRSDVDRPAQSLLDIVMN